MRRRKPRDLSRIHLAAVPACDRRTDRLTDYAIERCIALAESGAATL